MLRLVTFDSGDATTLPADADVYEVRLRDDERDLWVVTRVRGEDIARRAGGKFDAATARAAVEIAALEMAGAFHSYQARLANIPVIGARAIGPDGVEGTIHAINRRDTGTVVVLSTFPPADDFWGNAVPWSECRYAP